MDLTKIYTQRDRSLYENLDMVIIDEISMVRADIFDGIEKFLRLNGPKRGQPFGGVQLCVFGDLYQLPPVVSSSEEELFAARYSSPFFFASEAFKKANFETLELNHIYRQSDMGFIDALNRIREGEQSERIINHLNSRCIPNPWTKDDLPIVLTTTNAIADRTNHREMAALPGEFKDYEGKVQGDFVVGDDRLPAPKTLRLKKGAQVMMTKNDPKKRWVNGSIGIVHELKDNHIEIAIKNDDDTVSVCKVKPEKWESIKYSYEKSH